MNYIKLCVGSITCAILLSILILSYFIINETIFNNSLETIVVDCLYCIQSGCDINKYPYERECFVCNVEKFKLKSIFLEPINCTGNITSGYTNNKTLIQQEKDISLLVLLEVVLGPIFVLFFIIFICLHVQEYVRKRTRYETIS